MDNKKALLIKEIQYWEEQRKQMIRKDKSINYLSWVIAWLRKAFYLQYGTAIDGSQIPF